MEGELRDGYFDLLSARLKLASAFPVNGFNQDDENQIIDQVQAWDQDQVLLNEAREKLRLFSPRSFEQQLKTTAAPCEPRCERNEGKHGEISQSSALENSSLDVAINTELEVYENAEVG